MIKKTKQNKGKEGKGERKGRTCEQRRGKMVDQGRGGKIRETRVGGGKMIFIRDPREFQSNSEELKMWVPGGKGGMKGQEMDRELTIPHKGHNFSRRLP